MESFYSRCPGSAVKLRAFRVRLVAPLFWTSEIGLRVISANPTTLRIRLVRIADCEHVSWTWETTAGSEATILPGEVARLLSACHPISGEYGCLGMSSRLAPLSGGRAYTRFRIVLSRRLLGRPLAFRLGQPPSMRMPY
jgi:hypothetical protein